LQGWAMVSGMRETGLACRKEENRIIEAYRVSSFIETREFRGSAKRNRNRNPRKKKKHEGG